MNTPGGNAVALPGTTIVRFETNGIFDPANLAYYIVINTTGNNTMPFYLGANSNYVDWSYVFEVGGSTGTTSKPVLYQVYQNPTTQSGVQFFPVPYSDAAYTFSPTVPVASVPGGFTFTFNRCILNIPPPNVGPSPTPAPTAAPTSGDCPPFSFPGVTNLWNVNIFTVGRDGVPIDSLEPNGPNDTSYTYTVDVSQVVDNVHVKPVGSAQVQNPEASIYGLEVLTTP